jgi:hypothetical protein
MTIATRVCNDASAAQLQARNAGLPAMCDSVDVQDLPDLNGHRVLQNVLRVFEPHAPLDQSEIHEQSHAVCVHRERSPCDRSPRASVPNSRGRYKILTIHENIPEYIAGSDKAVLGHSILSGCVLSQFRMFLRDSSKTRM